jgi:hypothetical protein
MAPHSDAMVTVGGSPPGGQPRGACAAGPPPTASGARHCYTQVIALAPWRDRCLFFTLIQCFCRPPW